VGERERGRGRSCRGEKLGSLDSRENRGEDGKGDGSLEGKKKRIKKQNKKKGKEISVLGKKIPPSSQFLGTGDPKEDRVALFGRRGNLRYE
jgi:hypothetical protein